MRILLICTGNTCRSSMAAGLLRELLRRRGRTDVVVTSAGIAASPGDPAAAHAVAVLAERGIDLRGHRARRLPEAELDKATLILTMTEGHKHAVLEFHPNLGGPVYTVKEAAALAQGDDPGDDLDISDPVGGSLSLYRATADELEALLAVIADHLDKLGEG